MKTMATAFTCILLTFSSFSQNQSSAHLTFKGVAINGTLNEFVAKMKLNGFTLVKAEAGVALLMGDFAGYKDCLIGVATQKQKDLVNKITVIFPDKDTWSLLSSNYFTIKDLLKQKYGSPFKCVEKFDTSPEPRDDYYKMHEVGMDRCKYYTIYETENGDIQLSIEHDGFSSSFVMLSYFDKINTGIMNEKALDDL